MGGPSCGESWTPSCAVSVTGDGEALIFSVFAHEVDALVRLAGPSLGAACPRALHAVEVRTGLWLARCSSCWGLVRMWAVGWRVGSVGRRWRLGTSWARAFDVLHVLYCGSEAQPYDPAR